MGRHRWWDIWRHYRRQNLLSSYYFASKVCDVMKSVLHRLSGNILFIWQWTSFSKWQWNVASLPVFLGWCILYTSTNESSALLEILDPPLKKLIRSQVRVAWYLIFVIYITMIASDTLEDILWARCNVKKARERRSSRVQHYLTSRELNISPWFTTKLIK